MLPLPILADSVDLRDAATTSAPTILVTGDSLSAAYGMALNEGWVALLQQRLRQQGYPHRVVNTSVSGETTAGALARLPTELGRHKPTIVLIELGGNDGLRGQPVKALRDNLGKMVKLSRKAGAVPVLFEMQIPANYGVTYTEAFRKAFAEVAQAHSVRLVPFLLSDIALDESAFQSDGIHPTAAVQPKLLDAVWPTITPLLGTARSGDTAGIQAPGHD